MSSNGSAGTGTAQLAGTGPDLQRYQQPRTTSTTVGGERTAAHCPQARKSHPCWFLVADGDQAIPPEAERQFAARMGATTVEIPANHVAMVSHPDDVVQLIKNAAAVTPVHPGVPPVPDGAGGPPEGNVVTCRE